MYKKTSAYLLAVTSIVLSFSALISAQVPAEFAAASTAAPANGPVTSTLPARLLQNPSGTTFTAPNTTINVSGSTSLQQFTGVNTGTGNPVVFFGGGNNAGNTAPLSVSSFSVMNAIGSPANTNYSNAAGGGATGIDVTANYSFNIYTSVTHWTGLSTPSTNNVRIRMADLTLTFTSPVSNPYLHFAGLGGTSSALGFSTEFDLFAVQTTSGPISGTLTKLQGNTTLSVTATQVNNGAASRGADCGTNIAGCGTVRVNGTNIVSITLRVYMTGDGSSATWGTAGNHSGDRFSLGVSLPETFSISGTVFNDLNGLTDSTVNGTGINNPSGVQLYANLIDPSDNSVIGSVAVGAGGTYSFAGVPGNTTARVEISTNQGTALSAAPAIALPAGWANTGESPSDITPNGALSVSVMTANFTNANFGIEQRPTANNNTAPSQVNPGGSNNLTVPAATFSATDPAGGTITAIRITAFPNSVASITINGITYTSATFPAGGVTVPTNAAGNPTQLIQVNPFDGPRTINIPFVAIDNAGVESSAPGIATLPVSAGSTAGEVTITGRVLDDQGRGAARSVVSVLGQNGVVRTALTNQFGYFRLTDLDVNELYEVRVTHKRFTYASRTVSLSEDLADLDFIPQQ